MEWLGGVTVSALEPLPLGTYAFSFSFFSFSFFSFFFFFFWLFVSLSHNNMQRSLLLGSLGLIRHMSQQVSH
jgi:hypothetical protein